LKDFGPQYTESLRFAYLKYMKHMLFILLFIAVSTHDLNGQRKWKDKYYLELTDDNFRDFKPFNRPIDLKKPDYKLINAAVYFVSNEARIEHGIDPLAYQENLEIMAWNHSIHMGKDDFFDHIDPENRKRKRPEQRASLAGIKNPRVSENITAIGGVIYNTYLELADAIVDTWINSPPHRKTLYSTDALELGCGVYYYEGVWQKNKSIYKQGNGFWLATQNFQLYTKVEAKTSKDKRPK